jgi:hypothetical protein
MALQSYRFLTARDITPRDLDKRYFPGEYPADDATLSIDGNAGQEEEEDLRLEKEDGTGEDEGEANLDPGKEADKIVKPLPKPEDFE